MFAISWHAWLIVENVVACFVEHSVDCRQCQHCKRFVWVGGRGGRASFLWQWRYSFYPYLSLASSVTLYTEYLINRIFSNSLKFKQLHMLVWHSNLTKISFIGIVEKQLCIFVIMSYVRISFLYFICVFLNDGICLSSNKRLMCVCMYM